jgi:hypothetical protein
LITTWSHVLTITLHWMSKIPSIAYKYAEIYVNIRKVWLPDEYLTSSLLIYLNLMNVNHIIPYFNNICKFKVFNSLHCIGKMEETMSILDKFDCLMRIWLQVFSCIWFEYLTTTWFHISTNFLDFNLLIPSISRGRCR